MKLCQVNCAGLVVFAGLWEYKTYSSHYWHDAGGSGECSNNAHFTLVVEAKVKTQIKTTLLSEPLNQLPQSFYMRSEVDRPKYKKTIECDQDKVCVHVSKRVRCGSRV